MEIFVILERSVTAPGYVPDGNAFYTVGEANKYIHEKTDDDCPYNHIKNFIIHPVNLKMSRPDFINHFGFPCLPKDFIVDLKIPESRRGKFFWKSGGAWYIRFVLGWTIIFLIIGLVIGK